MFNWLIHDLDISLYIYTYNNDKSIDCVER